MGLNPNSVKDEAGSGNFPRWIGLALTSLDMVIKDQMILLWGKQSQWFCFKNLTFLNLILVTCQ